MEDEDELLMMEEEDELLMMEEEDELLMMEEEDELLMIEEEDELLITDEEEGGGCSLQVFKLLFEPAKLLNSVDGSLIVMAMTPS